jgi:hypothetical protein
VLLEPFSQALLDRALHLHLGDLLDVRAERTTLPAVTEELNNSIAKVRDVRLELA